MSTTDSLIKDLVEAIKHNTYAQIVAIRQTYLYEQFKEANKVPVTWKAYTIVLPGRMVGDPINVFPRNPKRSGFSLQNASTSSGQILYGSTPFNITEVGQLLNNTGQGVINVGVLQPGTSTSIVTSGPLFVGNAGVTSATLEVNETIYQEMYRDSSNTTPSSDHWEPHGSIEGFFAKLAKDMV